MVPFDHDRGMKEMFMRHRVERTKGIWHVYRCMGNFKSVCLIDTSLAMGCLYIAKKKNLTFSFLIITFGVNTDPHW